MSSSVFPTASPVCRGGEARPNSKGRFVAGRLVLEPNTNTINNVFVMVMAIVVLTSNLLREN